MKSTTVRITDDTHDTLQELSEKTGKSMQTILKAAIELYRRQRFLDDMNEAYASLKSNPKEWEKELQERAHWDGTLLDGLKGKK